MAPVVTVPLARRPHVLKEVWPDGPDDPSRIRVVFEDDRLARYFLDPERCVVVRRDDCSLGLLSASDEAFVFEPQPNRDMTEEDVLRELELYGRSGGRGSYHAG